jgi:hypothetical protein
MAKPELLQHVKFGRLQRALACRRFEALGILEALFHHCYACSSAAVGSADDIAWIVDWPIADAPRLAAGLEAAGFLDADPKHADAYVVHDLWRHAPYYAKQRDARQRALEPPTQPELELAPEENQKPEPARTSAVPLRTGPDQHQKRKSSAATAPTAAAPRPFPSPGEFDYELAAPEAPPPTVNGRVLARLCHEIAPEDRHTWADADDALRWHAARFGVPYTRAAGMTALERVGRGRGVGFAELVGVRRRGG